MPRRAFHLVRCLLFVAVLLYGCGTGRASEAPFAPDASPPSAEPHVALLLPTGSEAFAAPAEAVRAGFLEAAKKSQRPLPVRLYAVTDDPQVVIAAYRRAVAAGAELVVGPLTRNGVTALAAASEVITVPTLALNVPERAAATPFSQLFTLSLQIEAEARQVAQLALSEGRRRAFIVSTPAALSQRMREAFTEAFERGGGHVIADYAYAADPAALERLRQASALGVADMVFYAIDAPRLRTVRPYTAAITGYGTSQLNPGAALASPGDPVVDVRFVDMPWMEQPEHPAVMVYARAGPRENDDFERLYALGVDACRLAQDLLTGKRDIELDGVTGRLRLGLDGQFRRGLLVTLIDSGRLTVLGESRP